MDEQDRKEEQAYYRRKRREDVAMAVLGGLASRAGMVDPRELAECAFRIADAFIAEQDKKGETE